MKTNTKFFVYVWIVLVLLFNVVSYFASPDSIRFSGKFWVAYGCVMAAYVVQLIVNVFLSKNKDKNFINISIIYINIILTIISTVTGILSMVLVDFKLNYVVIANAVILALDIILVLSLSMSKNEVIKTETNVKQSIMFIKEKTVEVKILYDNCSQDLKEDYKNLYELLLYSDNVSNDKLEEINKKIDKKIIELKNDTTNKNIIKELISIIKERNDLCKLYK
ncbi:MAG: hypothetical protein MJ211_15365 [Bacteroidales bacterium]|nr:hypothetical protein [Bacteroidales bacterium]